MTQTEVKILSDKISEIIKQIEDITLVSLNKQQSDYLKLLLVTEIDSGQTSTVAKVVFNQILEKLHNE